jgi:hypothetical protein
MSSEQYLQAGRLVKNVLLWYFMYFNYTITDIPVQFPNELNPEFPLKTQNYNFTLNALLGLTIDRLITLGSYSSFLTWFGAVKSRLD